MFAGRIKDLAKKHNSFFSFADWAARIQMAPEKEQC
jgi:hypothetical protein